MLIIGPLCILLSLFLASLSPRMPKAAEKIELYASFSLVAGCLMVGAALPSI
jgi:hypothetical protein